MITVLASTPDANTTFYLIGRKLPLGWLLSHRLVAHPLILAIINDLLPQDCKFPFKSSLECCFRHPRTTSLLDSKETASKSVALRMDASQPLWMVSI